MTTSVGHPMLMPSSGNGPYTGPLTADDFGSMSTNYPEQTTVSIGDQWWGLRWLRETADSNLSIEVDESLTIGMPSAGDGVTLVEQLLNNVIGAAIDNSSNYDLRATFDWSDMNSNTLTGDQRQGFYFYVTTDDGQTGIQIERNSTNTRWRMFRTGYASSGPWNVTSSTSVNSRIEWTASGPFLRVYFGTSGSLASNSSAQNNAELRIYTYTLGTGVKPAFDLNLIRFETDNPSPDEIIQNV